MKPGRPFTKWCEIFPSLSSQRSTLPATLCACQQLRSSRTSHQKQSSLLVRPWKGSSRKNKLPPKLWMEPHLRSNTEPREPIQENAFCSCYRDAYPPPTRNSTVSLGYFHRGSLHGREASCRLRQTSAPCFSRLPRTDRSSSRAPARSPTCPRYFDWQPGSPLSFLPTFGGGLPISASDRSPLAGVCAPQLLGHRGPQSARDALAEVGRRRVGGETGSQRPREVGGAKPSTGCGRLASASHVGTAHAVGWEAEAPPTSAAALALAAPAARLGRGAGLLASVKPRVNVSGARGAGGGRSSGGDPARPGAGAGTRLRRGPQQREAERQHARRRVDVCLGVVRELCCGWSSSTLRRDRGGEGRRRERWSPERAR